MCPLSQFERHSRWRPVQAPVEQAPFLKRLTAGASTGSLGYVAADAQRVFPGGRFAGSVPCEGQTHGQAQVRKRLFPESYVEGQWFMLSSRGLPIDLRLRPIIEMMVIVDWSPRMKSRLLPVVMSNIQLSVVQFQQGSSRGVMAWPSGRVYQEVFKILRFWSGRITSGDVFNLAGRERSPWSDPNRPDLRDLT